MIYRVAVIIVSVLFNRHHKKPYHQTVPSSVPYSPVLSSEAGRSGWTCLILPECQSRILLRMISLNPPSSCWGGASDWPRIQGWLIICSPVSLWAGSATKSLLIRSLAPSETVSQLSALKLYSQRLIFSNRAKLSVS